MAARLKVFSWSNGFHAFTVATTSREKALAAWGMEQDIFKDGLARQIDHGPDHDAALASPGEVIQRGEAIDAGSVTKAPKTPRRSSTAAAKKRAAKLESDLAGLDLGHGAALEELDDQIAALAARRQALVDEQRRERANAVKALKAARDAT